MKKSILSVSLLVASISLFNVSCRKEISNKQKENDNPAEFSNLPNESLNSSGNNKSIIASSNVIRVYNSNFIGFDWTSDQVNMLGTATVTSPNTPYVNIECAPVNHDLHGLARGAAGISMPTSSDPTLRRIRLRNVAYSGTHLADLTKFEFSTFIVSNINHSAPTLALQIDANGDNVAEFNIFFDPRDQNVQNAAYPVVLQNTWQEWNALNGTWHLLNFSIPELPGNNFTLQQLFSIPRFQNARIINTLTGANAGGGIRFTIGGGDPDYNDFKGYIDAFMIGVQQQSKATLYDFVCED